MADEVLLALSTFPDHATAERIAHELIAGRYAACANIAAPVESIYWWKNEVETATEVLVFFKTTADHFSAFQKKLRSLHPYDTPEIISFRVADGLPEYLRWVTENCSERGKKSRKARA
jgi:periplasmic divalent cation tolerance protein